MNGLDQLRQEFPWPEECPKVPKSLAFDGLPDGWCCGENIAMFGRLCNDETDVIIELGSWLGRSALHLLGAAPKATLICVDHWEGSAEHRSHPEWKLKLPTLYETFLRHLWAYRSRVIPLRGTTLFGLDKIASLKIPVKVIYIDASHDPLPVKADISKARENFPEAVVCGDDWTWESVREGVRLALAAGPPCTLGTARTCWWLE